MSTPTPREGARINPRTGVPFTPREIVHLRIALGRSGRSHLPLEEGYKRLTRAEIARKRMHR